MKISIRHQFSLENAPGTARAALHLLLTPRDGSGQKVTEWLLDAEGVATAERFGDGYGNIALLVTQTQPAPVTTITVSGLVETYDKHGVVGRMANDPVPALFRRVTALTRSNVTLFGKFRNVPRQGRDRIGVLHQLMERVGEFYAFGDAEAAPEPTQSQSQSGQSQSQGQGDSRRTQATARDIAHAFVGAARALDIPARYVTGYLAGSEDGPAAFHAWAEAWDDGLGWIGFDAALGLCPTDRHVRLAVGLDAGSAAPVRAVPVLGEAKSVSLSVEAVQQSASVPEEQ